VSEQVEAPKANITLPGTVEKIIKSPFPGEPEKVQITLDGADELYREIRIENSFENEKGEHVAVKPGAEVDVNIVAPEHATEKKDGAVEKRK
jgi:hypothetical protein